MKHIISFILLTLVFFSACSQKETAEDQAATQQQPTSKEVSYAVDTTTMKGYMAYPAKKEGKKPGILVVHEWWGHNDYARKRADMLADLGYVALAVDMYGDGKQAAHPEDAQKFAMSVMGNLETAKARFMKAFETLKADPQVDPTKIGAIGYCFGGSVVLSMANAGVDLQAVAAFHAGLQLPIQPEKEKVKAKVLVCNGGADPMVTEEHITNFKQSMKDAGVDLKFVSYEGAQHAFTNPGATDMGKKFSLPLAYDETADQESWEELKNLFATTF
jgi:dienelactone hydrolase